MSNSYAWGKACTFFSAPFLYELACTLELPALSTGGAHQQYDDTSLVWSRNDVIAWGNFLALSKLYGLTTVVQILEYWWCGSVVMSSPGCLSCQSRKANDPKDKCHEYRSMCNEYRWFLSLSSILPTPRKSYRFMQYSLRGIIYIVYKECTENVFSSF